MAAKENTSTYRATGFIIAAVALFLILTLNSILVYATYNNTTSTFTGTSREMNTLNTVNGVLNGTNREILELVVDPNDYGGAIGHFKALEAMLNTIDKKMQEYDTLPNRSENAMIRFKHARAYVEAVNSRITGLSNDMMPMISIIISGDPSIKEDVKAEYREKYSTYCENLADIYTQELRPLVSAASEMCVAAINIGSATANRRNSQSIQFLYVILIVLGAILIVGEVAIFLVARYAKRSIEELDRKNQQFAEASSKLMRSREKMEDIATTNILTGMKNRYALEQDISDRLANEQFNIAVFDLDNFRSINDMYGYDFGDEYLSQISERLKSEFGQFAELYNITGNEFCFVFNRDVSDSQAPRIIDNITQVMTAPYTVYNLSVQLTVSGATYHYLAGDCLNVNSLLVKMDNVLRNAKRSGGGMILQVTDI